MKLFHLLFSLFYLLYCQISWADEVIIYTWEEYFDPEVIAEFEKVSGHKVSFVYFDSEPVRDEVVTTGRAIAYDLFILDGASLQIFKKQNVLLPIDTRRLSNHQFLEDRAQTACDGYGVPYALGTIGIGYRASKFASRPNSWMALINQAKAAPNTVVIPAQEQDTIAVGLMALGFNPMSNDEAHLKQAYQLLADVKPSLLALRNAESYAIEQRQASQMDMAVIYAGETESIAEATGQDDWRYSVPDEGTLIWYECLAAHAKKPLSEAAWAFLDFINQPEVAIRNAESIWFATTNHGALKQASEEYRQDPELFPPKATQEKSYQYQALDTQSLKQRNRILSVLMQE